MIDLYLLFNDSEVEQNADYASTEKVQNVHRTSEQYIKPHPTFENVYTQDQSPVCFWLHFPTIWEHWEDEGWRTGDELQQDKLKEGHHWGRDFHNLNEQLHYSGA